MNRALRALDLLVRMALITRKKGCRETERLWWKGNKVVKQLDPRTGQSKLQGRTIMSRAHNHVIVPEFCCSRVEYHYAQQGRRDPLSSYRCRPACFPCNQIYETIGLCDLGRRNSSFSSSFMCLGYEVQSTMSPALRF